MARELCLFSFSLAVVTKVTIMVVLRRGRAVMRAARVSPRAIGLALLVLLVGAPSLYAQGASGDAKKARRFDSFSGIVFACRSATGFAWTVQACNELTVEFRRRAEAAKLRFAEVPITADFNRRKLETIHGFDRDKAVRVLWTFFEETGPKSSLSVSLSSNFVYLPSVKDHPDIAQRRRIPMYFLSELALFDPDVDLEQAEPSLTRITNSFFMVGEM